MLSAQEFMSDGETIEKGEFHVKQSLKIKFAGGDNSSDLAEGKAMGKG
jgi:hypothetical protein